MCFCQKVSALNCFLYNVTFEMFFDILFTLVYFSQLKGQYSFIVPLRKRMAAKLDR